MRGPGASGTPRLRVAVAAHVLLVGALLAVPFALRSEVFVLRLFNQVFLNVTILLGFLLSAFSAGAQDGPAAPC